MTVWRYEDEGFWWGTKMGRTSPNPPGPLFCWDGFVGEKPNIVTFSNWCWIGRAEYLEVSLPQCQSLSITNLLDCCYIHQEPEAPFSAVTATASTNKNRPKIGMSWNSFEARSCWSISALGGIGGPCNYFIQVFDQTQLVSAIRYFFLAFLFKY